MKEERVSYIIIMYVRGKNKPYSRLQIGKLNCILWCWVIVTSEKVAGYSWGFCRAPAAGEAVATPVERVV